MRVHIGSIRKNRGETLEVTFHERVPSPVPSEEGATIVVGVNAHVTNSGQSYRVKGEIHTTLELHCDRCLERFQRPTVIEFQEEFRRRKQRLDTSSAMKDEQETDDEVFASMFPADDDADTMFDGESFTLDRVVRDYLLLEMPSKAICRDDCQGICPQCGQNLNESACSCEDNVVDPRLAGLADFFKDQN